MQPPLEKASLRRLLRQAEGALVSSPGLLGIAEPSAQIRPRRMRQVVVGRFTVARPLFKGSPEGVMQCLLGKIEVAKSADEGSEDAS